MVQHWYVSHSREGYAAHLVEVPWWALAASRLVDSLDGHLGHIFCGQGMPEWLWRVPVGRPVYDPIEAGEPPFLVNSLAGKVVDVFNVGIFLDSSRERVLLSRSVSREEAAALGCQWDEVDNDD